MKTNISKMFRPFFALLLCAAALMLMIPAPMTAAAAGTVSQTEIDKVLSYYSGGTKSGTIEYDCGNAVTGGGEKSYLTVVTGTTAAHFSSFQTKLKNAGYTAQRERTVASNSSKPNSFGSYLAPDGSYRVYTYHFPDYGETRIILDTEKRTVNGFAYEPQAGNAVEPKLVLWGLPMSANGHGYGEKVTADQPNMRNCGAMVVIRMPDNSLFIHDGGDVQQWNDEACTEFVRFCRELTGTGEGEKMVINTWFLSHAHCDHFMGFYRFINKEHDEFDMKNIMYTIDDERGGSQDLTGVMGLLKSFYPDVQYYKPHTGEVLDIAGVTIDVIYALEDRYLPNSSGKLITDTGNQGGTYRSDMYKSNGSSDFNDTSTVVKITFANGISSILYGDMNLAETVLLTVYPDSVLKTDIMMLPHHGHNTHTELVNKADSRVYLYTQHKGAVYGPDNDVSTLDMYGTYRESVRDKFIAMFPGMYVPAGTENVDYDIFWAGNETVTIDINQLGNHADAYYTTEPAMNFAYTGWGVLDLCSDVKDLSDVLVGVSDPVTEAEVTVTTRTTRFDPVSTGGLQDNGRYVIAHKQSGNIMSYDAVAVTPGRPNKATSLHQITTTPLDTSASDIYYMNAKGQVYIDHSNRARAIWILHQEGLANDAYLSDSSGDGGVGPWFGGKAYGEIWLNKGNVAEYDANGNKTEGRNGVYWTAVYGEDNNSPVTQYRHIDPRYADEAWVKTSVPTGDDASNPKKRYIIEDLGDGDFLVYWSSVSGQTVRFLTCDAYGNWGVKAYSDDTSDFFPSVPDKGSAELESLKLKFYHYKVFSGETDYKTIAFSGSKTFHVTQEATYGQVLSYIQENIVLKDMKRWEMGVPCSGTTPKVGSCYLKFDKAYPTDGCEQYTVSVLYRNDDNTDSLITTLTVNVLSQTLDFVGTTDYTVKEGTAKDDICAEIVSSIAVVNTLYNTTGVVSAEPISYSASPSAGKYWLAFDSGDDDGYAVSVNYRRFDGSDVPVKSLRVYVEDPIAVPTLNGKGFTLSFEDEILLNFYYTMSNTDDVAQQGMLVFCADPGIAEYGKADDVYPGNDASGSYIATTNGIAAKEMGDDRYYCAYAKLTDGTYVYSPLYQYSPRKYATNMLGKASTSDAQKALCVAMLNYGAAAQSYFGYRTEDLMNAGLTAEQQALVVGFDEALFKGAIAPDASKIGSFAETDAGFTGRRASVSFEGAFAINYYFVPSAEVVGSMKLYIWNPEAYAAASTLTADNASNVISMEAQTDGAYWGQVQGIAAKNLDETYYVAGVYTDAQGNSYCTGVVAYSLSRYCLNNATPGKNMETLASATAMYGYYAAQYFA